LEESRNCSLRTLGELDSDEIDVLVQRSRQTMLETIPELGGSEERARVLVPNFDADAMRGMYLRDLKRTETHRFVLAELAERVVGHAVFFVRPADPDGALGYLFTIYVCPEQRRAGIAGQLLDHAVSWLEETGATRVVAHTHVTNTPFVHLAESRYFCVTERRETPWPHLELVRRGVCANSQGQD
jgi:GNAT superfamily N-acetyltransferase